MPPRCFSAPRFSCSACSQSLPFFGGLDNEPFPRNRHEWLRKEFCSSSADKTDCHAETEPCDDRPQRRVPRDPFGGRAQAAQSTHQVVSRPKHPKQQQDRVTK